MFHINRIYVHVNANNVLVDREKEYTLEKEESRENSYLLDPKKEWKNKYHSYLSTPLLQAGRDTRSVFKQNTADLNSVFLFRDWLSNQSLRAKFALLFA